MKLFVPFLFFFMLVNASKAQTLTFPEDFGILLDTVQKSQIFSDQKKFVDCVPKFPPYSILTEYRVLKQNDNFNLKRFIGNNFDTILVDTSAILNHIESLWSELLRPADAQKLFGTLIPLKHPYIVPGGRFREVYYWDSYFTMLGLAESGKMDVIKNMLDNFADLISTYGHIPNGNRTYYLSRSQPPFFSLMVDLYAQTTEDAGVYKKYYSAMRNEYAFWNRGKNEVTRSFSTHKRVVQLKKGEFLNRYFDDLSTPRPESYQYDMETFHTSNRDSVLFRNIRAAAESGWDFSSRWFADGEHLTTIQTTDIIPVDLNCLLYNLEMTLSKGTPQDSVKYYLNKAETRKKLIVKYCWNAPEGYFFDFNFSSRQTSLSWNLAGIFPLYFNMVDKNVAKKVCNNLEIKFLREGGLVTTLKNTGQQWDAPNGWAPLQWIGYKSCQNYNENQLASNIAKRWTDLNIRVFFEKRQMMEKYNVVDIHLPGGGGEYPTQDGFGWTNGVFLKLWNEMHKN